MEGFGSPTARCALRGSRAVRHRIGVAIGAVVLFAAAVAGWTAVDVAIDRMATIASRIAPRVGTGSLQQVMMTLPLA